MIGLITGQVISNRAGEIIIKTPGGVGYLVFPSLSGSKEWVAGKEATILTYLAVRENALDLYGFISEAERELFRSLIGVSGIGPKTALHILSLGSISEIGAAINRGDVAYLTQVSGIGKKTAERIVVELKDKILFGESVYMENYGSGAIGDAVAGLVGLGYSLVDARAVVKSIDSKDKNTEQLLKEALQKIK